MGRQVGCRDGSLPAGRPGQLPEDVVRQAPAASDAWDGARPDAKAGEVHRAPADEDVEKSVDPAPVFRARDAPWRRERRCWLARWAEPVWTEPCTRVVVPSAELSSAAGAQRKLPAGAEPPGGSRLRAPPERLQPSSHSRQLLEAQPNAAVQAGLGPAPLDSRAERFSERAEPTAPGKSVVGSRELPEAWAGQQLPAWRRREALELGQVGLAAEPTASPEATPPLSAA
jgi:hypothetical protein